MFIFGWSCSYSKPHNVFVQQKKNKTICFLEPFFLSNEETKSKKTSYLFLKPNFCGFFLKKKVSVELLLLLTNFFKEVSEKVNLCWVFFEHLPTFFSVLLMLKKLLASSQDNGYQNRFVLTKLKRVQNQQQRLSYLKFCYFLCSLLYVYLQLQTLLYIHDYPSVEWPYSYVMNIPKSKT